MPVNIEKSKIYSFPCNITADYVKIVTGNRERKLAFTKVEVFQNNFGVDEGPEVDQVAFEALMNMLDFNNRYVYKGSQTVPPCETFVYQNVLTTVYPISSNHVANFKR